MMSEARKRNNAYVNQQTLGPTMSWVSYCFHLWSGREWSFWVYIKTLVSLGLENLCVLYLSSLLLFCFSSKPSSFVNNNLVLLTVNKFFRDSNVQVILNLIKEGSPVWKWQCRSLPCNSHWLIRLLRMYGLLWFHNSGWDYWLLCLD